MIVGSMASRKLGSLLGGRAGRCSPAGSHANAATCARAAVSLTQMRHVHAAFTSAVNDGDAAPATGSEEDRVRTAPLGEEGPVDRVAEKAADVGRKARGAAEEVKEAGRVVKDQAKEVGQDVTESVKKTRP